MMTLIKNQLKRGGSMQGVAEPGHCQGSISTAEYAKRMVSILLLVKFHKLDIILII